MDVEKVGVPLRWPSNPFNNLNYQCTTVQLEYFNALHGHFLIPKSENVVH